MRTFPRQGRGAADLPEAGRGRRSHPTLVVVGFYDDRHAVVEWFHQLVRVGRDERVGLENGAGGPITPAIPKAGHAEDSACFKGYGKGLLQLWGDRLPLVETIERDEAAAALICFAKRGAGERVSALALMVL